jgi:uncharacterized MAPEG superfamily protein
MEAVVLVMILALMQFFFFGTLVGRARMKYNVPAPAITGDPMFERYNRVHQNTMESLILFLPGMTIFGYYANPNIAVALGLVWIIGRFIYLRAYLKEPGSRSLGFALTFFPSAILLIGGGIAALRAML